jgi:hypothetical protein
MIRPVRFAILALLILGVFAVGAAMDWSASTRTEVPAIEVKPAPSTPLLTGQPATPIRRTNPAKAKSAHRKSRSATPDVRPVSPPERVSTRAASPSGTQSASRPRASTTTTASTAAPRKAPAQAPTGGAPTGGGNDGGTTTTTATPPTETTTPQTPKTGAAPAPASPEPAGDDDDDEDDDDDGDDGGDDD